MSFLFKVEHRYLKEAKGKERKEGSSKTGTNEEKLFSSVFKSLYASLNFTASISSKESNASSLSVCKHVCVCACVCVLRQGGYRIGMNSYFFYFNVAEWSVLLTNGDFL